MSVGINNVAIVSNSTIAVTTSTNGLKTAHYKDELELVVTLLAKFSNSEIEVIVNDLVPKQKQVTGS